MGDADRLFKRLDVELLENIEAQYFQEPKEFRSLIQVLEVLNQNINQINRLKESSNLHIALKEQNPALVRLQNQLDIVNKVIEEVVKFQHGGLNNSVDSLSEVVKEYTRGRDEIKVLKKSLEETKSVLTAKKTGQISLKELWLKKVELQESLRLVKDLEELKAMPLKVQRLMQQKRYYSSVVNLNLAVKKMFGEDLVAVAGLSTIREQIMDLKEVLLEACVAELRDSIVGVHVVDALNKDYNSGSDTEDLESDSRSELNGSQSYAAPLNNAIGLDDSRSVRSFSLQQPGRSSAPSLHHGNSPSMHLAATATSMLNWPLDLSDVDETAELSLVDPTTLSGTITYLRLLSKTVQQLQCEEDVERMILESIARTFRDAVILRCRERAREKLKAALASAADIFLGSEEEELKVHGKLLADYVQVLLDALLGLVSRLMYVLRVLLHSHAMKATEHGGSDTGREREHRDATRKSVLELWAELEEMVIVEVNAHLVEVDVRDIMDSNSASGLGLRRLASAGDEEEFGEQNQQEYGLVFKPSAKHAALLFKKVVAYNAKYVKLLREFSFEDSSTVSLANKARNAFPAPARKGLTVMQSLSLSQQQTQANAVPMSRLLEVLQQFLEDELIPVIQSSTNQVMRDLQTYPQLYSARSSASNGQANFEQRASLLKGLTMGQELSAWKKPSAAAERALFSVESLCHYWTQLFSLQHRNMMSVVVDRFVRGYSSAARELLLSSSFTAVRMQSPFVTATVKALSGDQLLQLYRQTKVFGAKATLEDAFYSNNGMSATNGSTNAGGSSGARTALIEADDYSLSNCYASQINAVWPPTFWDLTSTKHPLLSNSSNIASSGNKKKTDASIASNAPIFTGAVDNNGLALVAAVGYSCDWLARRLISSCTTSLKRGSATALGIQNIATTSLANNQRSIRQDLQESRQHLAATMLDDAKDLLKLSDECVAATRVELQLLCFYHLRKLIIALRLDELSISNTSVRAESSNTQGSDVTSTSEEESIINSFMNQLTLFATAVSEEADSPLVVCIFGPIASLIPAVMSKFVSQLLITINTAANNIYSAQDKARLLRGIVSLQQQLAATLQSTLSADPEGRRRILDVLTEEFEHLHRLTTNLHMKEK